MGIETFMWLIACNVMGLSALVKTVRELNYTIFEEVPEGHFIGDIFKDSHVQEENANVWESDYSILFRIVDSNILGFGLDNTGIFTTTAKIDRDAVCNIQITCIAKVVISIVITTAQYAPRFKRITVLVTIIDINDNSPQFPTASLTIGIMENAPVGTSFSILKAVDLDTPMFQTKGYRLQPMGLPFALVVAENNTPVLFLEELLDYEKRNSYEIILKAYDGGQPPKTSSMLVYIAVQNSNDNKPIFEHETYTVDILEDIRKNLSIVQVHADDSDYGSFGKVIYMFSKETKDNYGHVFGINDITGEIFVINDLDFEKTSVYQLLVIATDRLYQAFAMVVVQLLDVNDNAPIIDLIGMPLVDEHVWLIPEDAPVGTCVVLFTVTDYDTGMNGIWSCDLIHNVFKLLHEQTSKLGLYKICTNVELDREITTDYTLEIICFDQGIVSLSSSKDIEIHISDINDNPPVFITENGNYLFNLQENNYIGQYIGKVLAIDKDSGINAEVYYKLEDSVDMFTIDNNGVIRANVVFDREEKDQYLFTVNAFDRGIPQKTSIVFVNLHINDLDDEYPDFGQSAYYFWVTEDSPVATLVGRAFATDSDEIPHNQIEYSLKPGGMGSDKFSIDSQTGNITTLSKFNRNLSQVFNEVIVATDSGIPPVSTSINLTIFIMPENDNSLEFIYPSPMNNTISISNKVYPGMNLVQVAVKSTNLFYELTAGNDYISGLFQIQNPTGEISVRGSLYRSEFEIYQLLIKVTDLERPNRFNTANLNIVINGSLPFLYQPAFSKHNQTKPMLIGVSTAALLIILIILIMGVIIYQKTQESKSYNCREATLKHRLRNMFALIHNKK